MTRHTFGYTSNDVYVRTNVSTLEKYFWVTNIYTWEHVYTCN